MIIQKHKIVFAGSMGSGKTEAIKSLSDISVLSTEAYNTDEQSHKKMHTTVGIDYGEITLEDDIKVGLYGTPGQDRFNFMWGVISQGAIGAIILVDHTLKNAIEDLEYYINFFKDHTDNIIIGITHTDVNLDKSTHIYRQWLIEKKQNYPLFFIDARKKMDVLLLIEALITKLEIEHM